MRTEYPDPQFERKDWICLNGEWKFEIGRPCGSVKKPYRGKIEVPFCPESDLSGVGYTDFIPVCRYRKTVVLSSEQIAKRTVLRFGAVDYCAEVSVNGKLAGRHCGGYTPFSIDVTKFVRAGKNNITVCVEDDSAANVPSGKQSPRKESFGCFYSRVTGIWQTVWIEFTPVSFIKSVRYYPNVADCSVDVEAVVEGSGTLTARALYRGAVMGEEGAAFSHKKRFTVPLAEKHLWEPGNGRLYDVELRFGEDVVYSYFGLRETGADGYKLTVNAKPVFQRFVLDQGYYPDGIYTAKETGALTRDIRLATELGFNGARLHQKVFEPRYLYECDKAGFLVWGEFPSWGVNTYDLNALGNFLNEWRETVERDFNHPCIVAWCPLNEAWEDLTKPELVRDIRFCEAAYYFTKALDSTRPCIDTSGGYHTGSTDVFDVHCYRDTNELIACLNALDRGEMTFGKALAPAECGENVRYEGQPVSVSEFGGKALTGNAAGGEKLSAAGETLCVEFSEAWGYAVADDEARFTDDLTAAVDAMLACPGLSGFCYTQLYDVEQERNGLYTYDRKAKLNQENAEKVRRHITKTAAMEGGVNERIWKKKFF